MLHQRGDDPYQVLQIINNNAYKIDLLREFSERSTFNVVEIINNNPVGVQPAHAHFAESKPRRLDSLDFNSINPCTKGNWNVIQDLEAVVILALISWVFKISKTKLFFR